MCTVRFSWYDGKDALLTLVVSAAKQALRLASFMHKPSLLGIQALLMIGPYLTNSGRFLDAWTLFGTTIRLAHSIGLHRHPKYLNPAPPTQRECSMRQTLWWWMLHMDEQYSMTLGRPLGISGLGDCPPPHELTTDPQMLRFSEFVNYFTILARQILSTDRLNNAKIDEFTDSIRGLLETIPEMLQFDKSWLLEETKIPEWPLSAMAAGEFNANILKRVLTGNSILLQSTYLSDSVESPKTRQVYSTISWNERQNSPTCLQASKWKLFVTGITNGHNKCFTSRSPVGPCFSRRSLGRLSFLLLPSPSSFDLVDHGAASLQCLHDPPPGRLRAKVRDTRRDEDGKGLRRIPRSPKGSHARESSRG